MGDVMNIKPYKCPNTDCWWGDYKQNGGFCPECGTKLEQFGIRDGSKLMQAKKKVSKPIKETPKKEVKKYTGETLKGMLNGQTVTLILGDDSIKLEKKGFWTKRDKGFEEVKYRDIIKIGIKKGYVSVKVEIYYRGGNYELANINPEAGELFVNNVRSKLQSDNALETSVSSPLDEIKKAKELFDLGVLTEEQFEDVKTKCLERMK